MVNFEINSYNPQPRVIMKVVEILKSDGVIIYPTDTTYSFGCSIQSKKAMKRIYQIKNFDKKQPLTFICNDTKQFQVYTKGIPNPIFKIIRTHLPGPYTFIFEGSKLVPKTMLSPRSTLGVRIPDNIISCKIAEELQEPILSSSIPALEPDEIYQDGWDVFNKYKNLVDAVVNCGEIFLKKSAIIDFTTSPPEILREGDSDLDWVHLMES